MEIGIKGQTMQTKPELKAGMNVAYWLVEPQKPLFGEIVHVGLNPNTRGVIWLRVLDAVGNSRLESISISQIIGVVANGRG